MDIKKILFFGLFVFVCVKLDATEFLKLVLASYMFLSTLRRILQTPVHRIWQRYKARSCDILEAECDEMSHKEAVLLDGPSQ